MNENNLTAAVVLKKGKPSKTLFKILHNHYKAIALAGGESGTDYITGKWHRWTENPEIMTYGAHKEGKAIGFAIYNPTTSTIEEIVTNGSSKEKSLEQKIIDALIAKKNLIAATILKTDTEKYRWMLEYGFRPTRTLTEDGFPVIRMDLSTAVLLEKTMGLKPSRPYRKKERVAIEKIPETQTYEEIKQGLENLIKKLGGIKRFVKPGDRVVIKPNLVSDHGLKDGAYQGGIVTDIRVVQALTELVLPIAEKVIIAEGSSINRSETAKMFTHYGYDRLVDLDPKKVSLVDLNIDKQVEKIVPGGKRMLSRKIPLTLDGADVIISVPVLKIHFAAIVSLAIKHLQGAVPPLEKYMSHFFGLWQNLINIHLLIKPKLTIIDGLCGQEDFGPVSGTPKKMNLLIGGTNPVALDASAMRVMGIDPASSPPVLMAYMQGLGPIEKEKIEIIGPPIDAVKSPFKQPEINLESGRDFIIHENGACPGCKGYLHFALAKLRRPDPKDGKRQLIDRPFDKKVNMYLGPATEGKINPDETNIFIGICQQHNAEMGAHLPGCPPHAEVLLKGIFSLFSDVEQPKYADETEEEKLGKMLQEILTMP